MTSDGLIKHIVTNHSADGSKSHSKREFRLGYPKATEAELDLLVEAEEKAGRPPSSVAHAKQILGTPEPKPKPDYSSIWLSDMAWAQKYRRAPWEDTELALHATLRERKALEAVQRDLESKPTQYGFPGVAALVLARTMQQVSQDVGDRQLMLYAADRERSARAVIGLYLSSRLPNEMAN